jgi:hypothetical protein
MGQHINLQCWHLLIKLQALNANPRKWIQKLPNVQNINSSYDFSNRVCLNTILELNTWLLELLATSQTEEISET